jgi:PAS domain-containing protein
MKQIFMGNDSFETIFNTMPIPVFIVDNDVRILGYNLASAQLFNDDRSILKMRCGDAFLCINARDTLDGCGGGELCKKCVIRNAVTKLYSGIKVEKVRTQMNLIRGEKIDQVQMLVTTTPIKLNNELFALVILEDVTELMELRNLIPICSYCKKVRDDKEYWEAIENYLYKHFNFLFTHGVCPECAEKIDRDLKNM